MFNIDKDSLWEVFGVWGVCLVIILLMCLFCDKIWLRATVSLFLVFFAGFITYFFRIPDRDPVVSDNVVTSSADGKVCIIQKTFEKEYLKRECIQVSVFMDFFDVHANYWPISGEISYQKYHPGKYLLAFLPKASEDNEHMSVAVKNNQGTEILFKQIAGTFARRIVNYAEDGMMVVGGQQCGVIKFGSRLDIFLPLDADVKVELGQKVRACETVIANI